jgi:YidC/Oxa1 family membrane protein insertase
MEFWNEVVRLLTQGLVVLSNAYGGSLGLAIITLSLAVRLAMLPWTLRLMRHAEEQRRKMEALRPQLEKLRRRFRSDPTRLSEEMLALYRRHGLNPLNPVNLLSALAQIPIMAALSNAIREGIKSGGRFLWVGDLARPDILLTVLVAALASVAAGFAPAASRDARLVTLVVPAVLTGIFMWKLSAGLGLYWAVSSGVGVLQSWAVHRRGHGRGPAAR